MEARHGGTARCAGVRACRSYAKWNRGASIAILSGDGFGYGAGGDVTDLPDDAEALRRSLEAAREGYRKEPPTGVPATRGWARVSG